MIIRIFLVLLALNMLAFVVRAEASERAFTEEVRVQDVYALQEEMSGDFKRESVDMYAAVGSRLLTLSLSDSGSQGRTYASEATRSDHGIALLDEGACLNLKWNF